MDTLSEPLTTLIATAAELRAVGLCWADVAKKVNRSAERVRRWPHEYPDHWRRCYADAERLTLADIASEARHYLRQLIRSTNENIQLKAIQQSIKVRETDRAREFEANSGASGAATASQAEIETYIRDARRLSNEELRRNYAEFEKEYPAERAAEGTGADGARNADAASNASE
jgi:hypothetical protein